MKAKSLLLMAIIAVLVLAAAIWVSSSRAPESASTSPGPLAPGLSKMLDQVTQVRIRAAGDEVLATLEQDENGWVLREKNDYPVDLDQLRSLLSNIGIAQRIEAKTAMPERYAQLGVEDVRSADARGVAVDIVTLQTRVSYVFGDNPVRGTGTYVRVDGENQSWLVDKAIAVERKPANWLIKRIIDVGANRVRAVSVIPIEGPAFGLERVEGDPASDFSLQGVPPGRNVAKNYEREALAGLLSGLAFDDVFAASDYSIPEKTRVMVFLFDDGRRLRIEAWEQGGHTYARFDMTLDEDLAEAWLARPIAQAESAETSGGSEDDESAEKPVPTPPKVTRTDLDNKVVAFQNASRGWVYQLPTYKASNLNKDLEDYLKPKD